MPVIHVESIGAAAQALGGVGDAIVVVPVHNGYEDVVRCYASLFRWTPSAARVLVVDDCGADRRPIRLLDQLAKEPGQLVVVLHRSSNGGFVGACNDAFEATGRNDVILVNSDVVVGPEWFERLTAAANSSSLIATASTLTNHGSILSLPVRNRPDDRLPGGMDPADAARRIAQNSLQLRPTIPTAIGHCVYIKRTILEIVGPFDREFGTGYGEEVDFSQRAVKAGFRHCCADDVFTFHRGGGSFGEGATEQQAHNEAIINARYPWYLHWVVRSSTDEHSLLALAIDRARIALTGMTVAIDGTCLGGVWAGTQAVTLETIRALSEALEDSDASITVLHTPAITSDVAAIIDGLPNVHCSLVTRLDDDRTPLCDIIYRPYQVNSLDQLRWLRRRGRRLIVNQLDLISWSNPSYFPSDHAWLGQRDLTRLTLTTADGVGFISDFVRREVAAEGLLPTGTPQRVVYCGTTSTLDVAGADTARPTGIPDEDRPFLFVLGASYHHKNRVFAIRLLTALRSRGWDGFLVMAGPTPPRGNSMGDETLASLLDASISDHVVTLGDLSESQKAWIYSEAALSVYPTCSEGFGLVPFESARHRVPVLSSRQGSLDEILPVDILTLDTFDIADAATKAWDLLHVSTARAAQCDAINEAAAAFTWDRTARELLILFGETLRLPQNRTAGVWGEGAKPIEIQTSPPVAEPLRRHTSELVERQLQRLLELDRLKRLAAPDGSRRQNAARRSANWARRTATQSD